MKNLIMMILCLLIITGIGAQEQTIETRTDLGKKMSIVFSPGKHWIHSMKIFPLIHIKNRPQIAVWLEDEQGHFLQTLYVTNRMAKQSWRKGPGDKTKEIRRAEALPVWIYAHKTEYEKGVFTPTKMNPLPDLITSATPKKSFKIRSSMPGKGKVIIKVEVNHSTDFNAYYQANMSLKHPNYNGDLWGNGQPSVIYRGEIASDMKTKEVKLKLIGHGAPFGQNGSIDADLSQLDSALEIVDSVKVYLD